MDSGFVTNMRKNINALNTEINSFSGAVFTEDVWHGEGATAAQEYLNDKIKNKLNKVDDKLANLIGAIGEANKAEEFKRDLNSLDKEADNYSSRRNELQNKIDACKRKIKNYCS